MQHDRRVLVLALAAGLPAILAALILLWLGGYPARVQWTVGVLIVAGWLGFAFAVQERVIRPLQTLSNMIAALREGDFSIRARGAHPDDALGLALLEINLLTDTLRTERLGAVEATALLGRVMSEIDVAIFAFDDHRTLRLVNRGGEVLLRQPAARLIGRPAASLGLSAALEGDAPRVLDLAFAGRVARWEVRRSTFRQGGLPHQLVMLSDLSKALREEERQAWQRLIRVLSHEINNSLAPIKSIAGSLQALLTRDGDAVSRDDDLRKGLTVIANRSESLSRFMAAYSRLARLPRPKVAPVDLAALVRRVVGLETRLAVQIASQSAPSVAADADQLEQLLINLVSNAVDAALETGGAVTVGWGVVDHAVELRVEDEGPGVPETANLFVPFYTTKPEGSGIGLVLSRQIAEAHGGMLTLENRAQGRGCVARLVLPM
ncbi:MAG: PAS domain-containing sensor histidine kinase [Gemmatimonadetes bacterium]|nr:PAS domain-containing sensor histidine kinase [Gemmatimonadota bacterium]